MWSQSDFSLVNWPSCLKTIRCRANTDNCQTKCPGVPNVLCVSDCNCNTVFVDRKTGKTLTQKECNPGTVCYHSIGMI